MTPASRAAAAMRTVCAGVPPTGFSQKTCLPAAPAATHSSSWSMFGAVTTTTSTSSLSITSRQSSVAAANPNDSVACSRRAATLSAQMARRGWYVRSANSVGRRR